MKKLLLALAVLLFVVGGALLLVSRSTGPGPAAFVLSSRASLLSGLHVVRGQPEWIAFIPQLKNFRAELEKNPVTRGPFAEWQQSHDLTALRYLPGDFDLIAWQRSGTVHYAIQATSLQRSILRTGSGFSRNIPGMRLDGDWMTTEGAGGKTLSPDVLLQISELSEGRKGRAFLFVAATDGDDPALRDGRFLFPEGRPTVLAATLEAGRLALTSRSRTTSEPLAGLRSLHHPAGAFLSVKLGRVPHAIGELEKLTRVRISRLMDQGSMVALYKVDGRKVLPKLQGVVAIPADASRSAALGEVVESLMDSGGSGLERLLGSGRRRSERDGAGGVHVIRLETLGSVVEYAFPDGEFVVSFDKSSMDHYLEDRLRPQPIESSAGINSGEVAWVLRGDRDLLGRIEQVGQNDTVRLFAPELSHRIGELTRFTSTLPEKATLEATSTLSNAYDDISVFVTAK